MLVAAVERTPRLRLGIHDADRRAEGRAASGRPRGRGLVRRSSRRPRRDPGRPHARRSGCADEGAGTQAPEHLPYLLKLLAAASPLSIQAHPSKAQAEAGFAREEAAGIPRDAADRTYRDANHKPELIVAVSDTFRGARGAPRRSTRRAGSSRRLGTRGATDSRQRLSAADASPAPAIAWLLSSDAADRRRGDHRRGAARQNRTSSRRSSRWRASWMPRTRAIPGSSSRCS